MKAKRITLAVLLLAALSGAQASPLVIDTGTPSTSVSGALTIDATDWIAGEVSFAQSATLDSILVYLTGANTGETFDLTLYSNANGLPGTALASQQATFSADGWNGISGLAASAGAPQWTVGAGSYWVGVEVLGNSTLGMGALNVRAPNAGAAGTSGLINTAFYTSGVNDSYAGLGLSSATTFGLQVTAVPEPGTWVLMAGGLCLLAVITRRRASV